jgi:hypothetical protein
VVDIKALGAFKREKTRIQGNFDLFLSIFEAFFQFAKMWQAGEAYKRPKSGLLTFLFIKRNNSPLLKTKKITTTPATNNYGGI